jgi:hypothetical protein
MKNEAEERKATEAFEYFLVQNQRDEVALAVL